MPFKGVDIMDVKKEFVLKALDDRVVFTELCREYGIGTKCGYKWKKRGSLRKGTPALRNTQENR
jgi:transposase-like protein